MNMFCFATSIRVRSRKTLSVALCAVLLSLPGIARSAEGNAQAWSFDGALALGPSYLDVRCDVRAPICESDSVAKRISAAALYRNRFGAELSWERSRDYGGSQFATSAFSGNVDVKVAQLAALYRFGPKELPLQLRLGAAQITTEFTYLTGGTGSVSRTTWQPLIGGSMDMPLGDHFALRWDVRATRARVAQDASVISALTFGIVARF